MDKFACSTCNIFAVFLCRRCRWDALHFWACSNQNLFKMEAGSWRLRSEAQPSTQDQLTWQVGSMFIPKLFLHIPVASIKCSDSSEVRTNIDHRRGFTSSNSHGGSSLYWTRTGGFVLLLSLIHVVRGLPSSLSIASSAWCPGASIPASASTSCWRVGTVFLEWQRSIKWGIQNVVYFLRRKQLELSGALREFCDKF